MSLRQETNYVEQVGSEIAKRRGCPCGGRNGCGCFNMALRVIRTGVTVEQALTDFDNEYPIAKGR